MPQIFDICHNNRKWHICHKHDKRKEMAHMKDRYLYVCSTMDEYELPLAVAGSIAELAEMVGTTVKCICSTISHRQKKGLRSRFRKVLLINDDEELINDQEEMLKKAA